MAVILVKSRITAIKTSSYLLVQVFIEPTTMLCGTLKEVLVLVMVASTSSRADLRAAVRENWGMFQPTFFVMGLNIDDRTKQTVSNSLEAAEFGDLLVFDFLEHHLNQTLKTALMMKWTMEQCPEAKFLFKTEEDVMVNPWTLNKVLEQYGSSELIAGYIQIILEKAYHVPLITLEDVYFTYLVAHKELGLTLTHDRRLSPYNPWLQISCVYWNQAAIHILSLREMLNAWYFLGDLVIFNKNVGRRYL